MMSRTRTVVAMALPTIMVGAGLTIPESASASATSPCTRAAEGVTLDGDTGVTLGECPDGQAQRTASRPSTEDNRKHRICGRWYTNANKTRTVYACRWATYRQAGVR